MLFYLITSLVNAVTSLTLGFFVFSQNKKSNINRFFALFALSVAIWAVGYFFWQLSKTMETALFWIKFLMVPAVFVPIFYLHFVTSLLDLNKKLKPILVIGYLFALVFAFLNIFSSYFVKGVSEKLSFSFWPDPGIIFHIFLFTFFSFAILSWFLLINAWKKAAGSKRDQILYVFWGTFIGFLGGSTNYLLWYDIPVPPAGNWAVVVYVGMIAYAIIKKKLFDIKVVLAEFLVGIIAILLFIQAVISNSRTEFIWKFALFLIFIYFGYLLVLGVIREVKRRAELQKLYEQVDKLSKTKSEFISIASHQLRTPLTAIKGYISMIIEGSYGQLSEKQQKPLNNVYQSNERLIRLVSDLLNLSRLEAGKIKLEPKLSSLEEISGQVIDELKINAQNKELTLKLVSPKPVLDKITIDADKIRQAILNLVDNAIKYTKEGGITIELEQKENRQLVKISDSGEGLTKDEIDSLFKMFSRSTAGQQFHTEGMGIGLYVAKQFVQMHQGKIWVESKGKGKGSTFLIELPK